MSDFLDIITRGLDVATNAMGETFTANDESYSGVFSAIDSSVDYESLSGYDTTETCGLTVSKEVIATEFTINTTVTRADDSVWVIVESTTADQANYDYTLNKKES